MTDLLSLFNGGISLGSGLLLALSLLQQGLRYEDLVVRGRRSVMGNAISMVRRKVESPSWNCSCGAAFSKLVTGVTRRNGFDQ
jgi:hypothetical protein